MSHHGGKVTYNGAMRETMQRLATCQVGVCDSWNCRETSIIGFPLVPTKSSSRYLHTKIMYVYNVPLTEK